MKLNQNSVSIEILKSLEPFIKDSLYDPSIWNTLDVDYFPPRIERLWTIYEDYRIFLHIIHPTDKICLYHKHRWPAAFKQVEGSYEMGITYHIDEVDSHIAYNLPTLARFIINKGSYYEMTQTDCLHFVRPLNDISASIMITKDLYLESDIRKEVVDRVLNEISENRKKEILSFFKDRI
jgi:hypothetical protein